METLKVSIILAIIFALYAYASNEDYKDAVQIEKLAKEMQMQKPIYSAHY